jgi:hypothetical protein
MANDAPHPTQRVQLRLFVVGKEPHSLRARENLERILDEEHMECDLEVVDVLKDYRAALDNGVLIAPTLIITTGEARITIAGDMTDARKIKAALEML